MDRPAPRPEERKLKRPVVSEIDGTREGALVFCIAMMGGMIASVILLPGALTSFWVWVALLVVSIGLGVSVQAGLAQAYGFEPEPDED